MFVLEMRVEQMTCRVCGIETCHDNCMVQYRGEREREWEATKWEVWWYDCVNG